MECNQPGSQSGLDSASPGTPRGGKPGGEVAPYPAGASKPGTSWISCFSAHKFRLSAWTFSSSPGPQNKNDFKSDNKQRIVNFYL